MLVRNYARFRVELSYSAAPQKLRISAACGRLSDSALVSKLLATHN